MWGTRVDDTNYHVQFSTIKSFQKAVDRIHQGGLSLVQGSFRSGKTSILYALYDLAKEEGYNACMYM